MEIRYSIKYNRSLFIGLFVGICKLLISWIGVLLFFGNMSKATDKESSTGDRVVSLAAAGFLALLAVTLINGEAVYERKGWDLPE